MRPLTRTSDEDIALLKSTWPVGAFEDYRDFQHLRAVNADFDGYKHKMLAQLPLEPVLFVARDSIIVRHTARQQYAQQRMGTLARDILFLKVGAEVVATRTLGDVNSASRGRVESFGSDGTDSCTFFGSVRIVCV